MLSKLEVLYHGDCVGTLAMTPAGTTAFEYAPVWLANGFSISPFELPLHNGVFLAKPTPFGGGFGVFDDSLPDGWGLLVLDRFLASQGIDISSLNILDRLSFVGHNGRGALEFRPAEIIAERITYTEFDNLASEAKKILASPDYQGSGIEEFYLRGGSPGGARPKIFTHYEGKEWLVKFPARQDPDSIGRTEYEFSLKAKKSGVEMPETRLLEDRYFATERFDRGPGGEKFHVISMAGLVRADYRVPSIDYLHIFNATARLTHSQEELWKVMRLMAFNFNIGNKDDHAKNFAFIHREDGWHFAPAFDLLPGEGINGYRTTSINDSITPGVDDLVAVAVKAGLDAAQARKIITSC